jgi:hypothetical protein
MKRSTIISKKDEGAISEMEHFVQILEKCDRDTGND